MVDAASDLSESLYPPDDSITDFSLDLKIGELLLRVEPIDEEQRLDCLELLKEFGLGRLRHILPKCFRPPHESLHPLGSRVSVQRYCNRGYDGVMLSAKDAQESEGHYGTQEV